MRRATNRKRFILAMASSARSNCPRLSIIEEYLHNTSWDHFPGELIDTEPGVEFLYADCLVPPQLTVVMLPSPAPACALTTTKVLLQAPPAGGSDGASNNCRHRQPATSRRLGPHPCGRYHAVGTPMALETRGRWRLEDRLHICQM